MNVLGIETSCDETAAAVVADGCRVRSNVVFSQVALHQPYGGIVPEIASRNHTLHLPGVLTEAVRQAGMAWHQVDAVAVTYGPGLASSLLVGLSAAKALALRLHKPLIGINHLEAHVYSVCLEAETPAPPAAGAFLALIVSGGHTCLMRVDGLGQYRRLGQTRDDAAGEAFDKGAQLLGLGYPGGPAIDQISRAGNPQAVRFPRSRAGAAAHDGRATSLDFSFSGLKTALRYYLKSQPVGTDRSRLADIAASYQEAIVDMLVAGVARAMQRERIAALVVAGGVCLNHRLREKTTDLARRHGARLWLASPAYGGDNAAMVAGLAGAGQGVRGDAALTLDACPNLGIGDAKKSEIRLGFRSRFGVGGSTKLETISKPEY